MNRYNCKIITHNEFIDLTMLADTCQSDSTCATRFHRKKRVQTDFGTSETQFILVGQYPTDRLIIESIEYDIDLSK